jgi:hypothetical protein
VSPPTAGDDDAPGAPPLPPADLDARELPIHLTPSATILHRVHASGFGALFFGPAPGKPPRGRWDAPDGEFGVCYLAEEAHVGFAETFLREPGVTLIEEADMASRSLARIEARRDLRLAAVHGAGLARIGATAAVCSGAYSVSRAWALALHRHPDAPDGIRYRARHDDDGFAIALFDRAADAVAELGNAPLDPFETIEIAGWLDRYAIGLI